MRRAMQPGRCMRILAATWLVCLAGAFAMPAAATVAESPVAQGKVSVTYADPEKFAEARMFGFQDRYNRSDYLAVLKAYLVSEGGRVLDPGEHLAVTITDIKLAGAYEPWHGPQWNDVRFMRDIYPPRIDLHFRLTAADGKVLREGTRVLRGLDYLHRAPVLLNQTDPLRYDKALLQRWLRQGPDRL